MPISATGKRDRGFTLVELMATIAILAVATSAVVFAFPPSDDRTRKDADRFAARVALARDLAITNVRPVGLIVDQRGYRFEQRAEGGWKPLEAPQVWSAGVQMLSDGSGQRLVFDPVGLADNDQQITLVKGDERTQVRIAANGGVNVSR